MKPDAVQIRVLGALLEKQRTTPDVYPLTLNALRTACNQSTNRDPVVEYDDQMIRTALEELARRRWTRAAGGSRAAKYRHLLADTLQMRPDEQAVLAVLMLRGPQTPGELRQRTARLHEFASVDELETTIDRLVTRQLVVRLERAPGQKEGRVQQIMGGDEPTGAVASPVERASAAGPGVSVPAAGGAAPAAVSPPTAALTARVERLESALAGRAGSGSTGGGTGGSFGGADGGATSGSDGFPAGAANAEASRQLDERLTRLEVDVADLRGELAALREELGA